MGVYNRYLPQQEGYTPVEEGPRPVRSERDVLSGGVEQIRELMKRFLPEKLDSGDLLLLLVVLLLWREGEDNDLLLALGAALLFGDGT